MTKYIKPKPLSKREQKDRKRTPLGTITPNGGSPLLVPKSPKSPKSSRPLKSLSKRCNPSSLRKTCTRKPSQRLLPRAYKTGGRRKPIAVRNTPSPDQGNSPELSSLSEFEAPLTFVLVFYTLSATDLGSSPQEDLHSLLSVLRKRVSYVSDRMQKDTRRLHALRMREAFGPGDWDDTSTPALGSEPFDHRKYLTKTTPTKPSFNPAAQRKKPDVFELVFTDGLLECVLELARTQDVEKPFTIEMLRKSSGPNFRFWDQSCVIKDGYARYALIFLEPEDAEPEFRKKLYEDVYRSGVKVEPDDPGTLFWAVMFSVRIESPVHIKELKFRAGLVLLEVNAVKKAVVGKAQENTKIEHGLHSATKVMKNFTPHREQPRPGSEASHTLSQIIPPKVASITDLGSSAVVTVPALSSIASGVESKVPFISNEVASVDTVLVNDEKAARRSLDPIMPTELVPTATPAAKDQGLSLGDNSRKPSDAAHSIPPSASMLQASLLALNTFAKKSNPGEVIGLAISSSSSGMLADMLTNIGTRAIATSSSAKRVVSDGSSTTQEQNEPASLNFSNAANHATTASGARSSRYYFSAPSATTPTLVPGNRYSMAWSKPGSFVVGAARLTPQGMATRDSMPSLEDVERDLEAGTRLVSEFEVEEGLMLRDKRTELVKRLTKFIQAVATVFLSPWRGMLRLIRRG